MNVLGRSSEDMNVEIGIDKGITLCYLSGMKTAISVPDEIFREIEKFAEEHNYSRSEVFLIAVKEFFEKLKSKQLLDTLDEVQQDIETLEDTAVRKKAIKHYVKRVLKEPY